MLRLGVEALLRTQLALNVTAEDERLAKSLGTCIVGRCRDLVGGRLVHIAHELYQWLMSAELASKLGFEITCWESKSANAQSGDRVVATSALR